VSRVEFNYYSVVYFNSITAQGGPGAIYYTQIYNIKDNYTQSYTFAKL